MEETNASYLHPDAPQTKQDVYGRKPFALQLAKLLDLPGTSSGIVVGIEGAWGSGKSTVIKYLLESLPSDETGPIVVEFSPWMLSGADALVEALLTELAAGIGINASANKSKERLQAGQKILSYVGMLRHLKYLKYVPGVGFVGHAAEAIDDGIKAISGVSNTIGDVSDEAKKVAKDLEELVGEGLTLAQRKAEVGKALSLLNRGILIVVDDLDRLTSEEVLAVFQTIKALADFPRVAYLLAYDRNIVADGLGNGNQQKGSDYLEKIVQLAYPISPAFLWQLQYHFETLISSTLKRIGREFTSFELEVMEKGKIIACSLCRNPRDVVRLANRLTLSLASTAGEVNAADVIVAEALFQRFPAIRESILLRPQNYTGASFSRGSDLDATDWSMFMTHSKEERRQAWLKDLPSDSAIEDAKRALCFLFPILNGGQGSPIHHRRIAENSRLLRFLALTSVNGVQDIAEIEYLLQSPTGLGTKLSEYSPQESMALISHISAHIQGISGIDYPTLVRELCVGCTVRNSMNRNSYGFSSAVAEIFGHCFSKSPECVAELLPLVVSNLPLVYGLDTLIKVGASHSEVRHQESWEVENAPMLVKDGKLVSSAIEIWRRRAHQIFSGNSVPDEAHLFAIFYGLAKLGRVSSDLEAIKAFKTLCTEIDGGLDYFLKLAEPYRQFSADVFYRYVWSADEMADLVEHCQSAGEFRWYSQILREDVQVRELIAKRKAP